MLLHWTNSSFTPHSHWWCYDTCDNVKGHWPVLLLSLSPRLCPWRRQRRCSCPTGCPCCRQSCRQQLWRSNGCWRRRPITRSRRRCFLRRHPHTFNALMVVPDRTISLLCRSEPEPWAASCWSFALGWRTRLRCTKESSTPCRNLVLICRPEAMSPSKRYPTLSPYCWR